MTTSGTRLLVISADCHAGPPNMWGFRDHVDARLLADFDDYCRAIEAYERARTSVNDHAGGAPVHPHELEAGLWDPEIRRRYLDAEGLAGELERFPGLRIAITEQRTHWVAPVLFELDSIFDSPHAAPVRERLSLRPSEYFARQCYIGASFYSRPECERRHEIGVDRIMWGSDFPHMEGTWPWTAASLRCTFSSVPREEVELMVGGNAVRCYDFDPECLRRAADRVGPSIDELNGPAEIPDDERARSSFAFRQSGPWSSRPSRNGPDAMDASRAVGAPK
jgi:Amidohydrolase